MHNPNECAFGSQDITGSAWARLFADRKYTESQTRWQYKGTEKKIIMEHKIILVLPQQARIIPYIFWNEILSIEVPI